jgi:hypothetical protein
MKGLHPCHGFRVHARCGIRDLSNGDLIRALNFLTAAWDAKGLTVFGSHQDNGYSVSE